MVFEGENKVLEKDIFTKPKFIQTEMEWVAHNRIQVLVSSGTTSSTIDFFTVPDNQTLFITGVWINNNFNGSAASGSNASVSIKGVGKTLIGTTIKLGISTNTANSISYPMPIKVEEKGTIRVTSGSNNAVKAGIVGWLEPRLIS